ncbi:DUF1651 domain-containing protein [Synechococcus sp. CC9605]|uniref:DUF1651 domain-containing protein n=1 Tax=Synechococcus sp. (strain CC9605) TaxID=110662 RepID=UPI0035B564F7
MVRRWESLADLLQPHPSVLLLHPAPMTQRRMLRHNAIEAWGTMQKTGWVRCRPPVR